MDYNSYFEEAQQASRSIALLDEQTINKLILEVANELEQQTDFILEENRKDLACMEESNPKYDRLRLTSERIASIVAEQRNIAKLPSPLYRTLLSTVRPNGLKIDKISVPFGVVGIIYEARPNVTIDVFSLCLKTANVAILKGGSDADFSNKAIISVVHKVLLANNIPIGAVTLLPADRKATTALLHAEGQVDLIIPRGSQDLIEFVRKNATIPVIETGAGICHTYYDEFADREKGALIIVNAKTRRVSVCNALDCLLIHESRLSDLPYIMEGMKPFEVKIFADEQAYEALQGVYPETLLLPATEDSFGIEFLSYTMAVKTVSSLSEAIEHISHYSSKHSEAIVTENEVNKATFIRQVDAACVYSNAPTSFTDGAQFGLGAEIGISTQKLHARGPMGLEELCTYKWIIKGEGQIRT